MISLFLSIALFLFALSLSLSLSLSLPSVSLPHTHTLFTQFKGDALVDAAIEAYAADRDVTEFLDTLQILSSHTPEGDKMRSRLRGRGSDRMRKREEKL